MSDDPFTHFDLPGDPAPTQEVPSNSPPPDAPRRRGPRPGTKRGPRAAAPAATPRATAVAEKRGAAPPVALYAEVFGALAQPEAKAVATIVQSFSPQSQAAIAQAILKLSEK